MTQPIKRENHIHIYLVDLEVAFMFLNLKTNSLEPSEANSAQEFPVTEVCSTPKQLLSMHFKDIQ